MTLRVMRETKRARQSQEGAGDEEDRDIKANQTRAAPPQQPRHQQAQEVPKLHPSQPPNYSTSSIQLFQQTTTPPSQNYSTTNPSKKWGHKMSLSPPLSLYTTRLSIALSSVFITHTRESLGEKQLPALCL